MPLDRAHRTLPGLIALTLGLLTPTVGATAPQCPDANPLRNAYFGDLHVHTALSADAVGYDVTVRPDGAYQFAFEGWVMLPPLDEAGQPTRRVESARPLDFMAVTDHAEMLGTVGACSESDQPWSQTEVCQAIESSQGHPWALVKMIALPFPSLDEETCGEDLSRCTVHQQSLWRETQEAAHAWNEPCERTTFVGYEYSSFRMGSNLHRNVIFRNEQVPETPLSFIDAPRDFDLWEGLASSCLDAENGCDVLAIPHNMNISNGRMFSLNYPGAWTTEEKANLARMRMRVEPIVEVMQHKGDSECRNGLPGVQGGVDELCDFEKMTNGIFRNQGGTTEPGDCYEGPGADWVPHLGPSCLSRQSYVRTALIEGLRQESEIGVNPFKFGLSASTDTHNAIGGAVDEATFPGHLGEADNTPEKRVSDTAGQTGGLSTNPGGLIGVWATENTRDAIFDAMQRREVFGTSGPRMRVRLHGAWDYPEDLCDTPDRLRVADALGVPMGSDLPPDTRPGEALAAPRFLVLAQADPGTPAAAGAPLQRVQVIKGWVGEDGDHHQRVYDVAGTPDNGASVDLDTCQPSGSGHHDLCAVWRDPEFDPSRRSVYYVRAVENPTCRYSQHQCIALPEADRPASCAHVDTPRTVQERAWSSPIWYTP